MTFLDIMPLLVLGGAWLVFGFSVARRPGQIRQYFADDPAASRAYTKLYAMMMLGALLTTLALPAITLHAKLWMLVWACAGSAVGIGLLIYAVTSQQRIKRDYQSGKLRRTFD